jgi:putative ABC transport system permease protein
VYNAVRETIRQLWRGRSRAAAIIAVMALGIGSCVTVFSMVSAVLLAEWPYADADRIAIVWHARTNVPGVVGMSPGDVDAYRASLRTFEQVAAVTTRGYNAGATNPFRVTCGRITPGMFSLLGVAPERGRWFTEDEDRRRETVVVVSERVWRAQLGSDAGYPGRDLLLDAVPYRVVGIMPEAFVFPPEGVQGLAAADCWVPASFSPAELATPAFNYVLFAKRKPGVTLEQAGADANAGAQRIWATYPAAVQSQVQLEARVVPLIDHALAGSRTPMLLFAGAAALLLLIGCSNVANFLMTTLDIRQRELSVRAALGATRGTLIAQLLLESISLAVAGGLAGAALASGLLAAIVTSSAGTFPRLGAARIDLFALGFAVVCSTVAGLVGGLAPALRLRARAAPGIAGPRVAASEAKPLQHALPVWGGASLAVGRERWRRCLIAFEVSLAVMVLVLAGVLARSVERLNAVATGFSPDGLFTFSVALPATHYPGANETSSFANEVVRQLTEIRGVAQAAAGSALPIGSATATVVAPLGESAEAPKYRPALRYAVTPAYAVASGVTVRNGRFLEPVDAASGARVAVVNETLARSLWPGGESIGHSILLLGDQPVTIVGVVADVRQAGPLRPSAPALYVPIAQVAERQALLHFLVRSDAETRRLALRAREIVANLDPALPPFALRTGNELVAGTMTAQRFNMLVLGVFAVLAMSLAVTGMYAVLSHFVQHARRDFGIRQALGATTGRIVASVMGWAMAPVLAGIAIGILAASGASTLIASLLFGVSSDDPATLIVVAVAVTVVSAASLLPTAIRASRGDVSALLRQE